MVAPAFVNGRTEREVVFFGRIRRLGGSAREAALPSTHNRFFSSQMNPVHLEHRACACTRARSTSVCPSPLSSAPLPVTSRRVMCHEKEEEKVEEERRKKRRKE